MYHAVFSTGETQWRSFVKHIALPYAKDHVYHRITCEYDLRGLRFHKVIVLDGVEDSRLILEAKLRRLPH